MTQLLEAHTVETGPAPTWAVVWLHGLGADGFDFAPLVPELIRPDWPSIRFVFPHAPVRKVTINNGYPMRAWYDIRDMDFANRADLEGVRESVAQVEALIADEIARGIAATNIILAGFSQGGAIALSTLIESNVSLAGVIALSTYLPGVSPEGLTKNTPVFMAHGTQDPVVPFAAGDASRQGLQKAGLPLTWNTYPMQHQVAAEEVADLRAWMDTILAK